MGTVTVENLKKSFGKVQAIAGISFEKLETERKEITLSLSVKA